MEERRVKTRGLVEMALFSAIVFILALSPLGYIPLGFMDVTTIHIPVIIAGVVLGWKKGAFIGSMFGLSSLLYTIFRPSLTAFFFSPFVSGDIRSLIICFIPRILIGIVAYFVYKGVYKVIKNRMISVFIAGVAGSMVNTILVLSMIYLFFASKYAEIMSVDIDSIVDIISVVAMLNGGIEAIIAGIISSAVCITLFKVLNNRI